MKWGSKSKNTIRGSCFLSVNVRSSQFRKEDMMLMFLTIKYLITRTL